MLLTASITLLLVVLVVVGIVAVRSLRVFVRSLWPH